MQFEIQCAGSYPALEVTLEPGESFVSEAGAMAWMTPNVSVKTAARGGVGGALKRSLLGGESFFQNTYTTESPGGRVTFVAGQPGDIRGTEMEGERLMLERGAYLASTPDVQIDSKFQGLKGLFAEGVFALQATGSGTMFWNTYGDVHEIEVAGEYVVDNGYAVAWDASLEYKVSRSGKKISSFLFGDQLVMRFSGQGRVWVQSRSPRAMANFVFPYRPVKQRG